MTDREAYLKRNKLKTAFKLSKAIRPFYSGGPALLSSKSVLYSCLDAELIITDLKTGQQLSRIQGDSAITSLSLTPSSLVIAFRSQALSFYSLPVEDKPFKTIARAHDAPVITMSTDPTGTLVATGSSDGIVKIWDTAKGHCTHVFKGHGGVISAFTWHIPSQSDQNALLISAADDCRIRVWNLHLRSCLLVLEGHESVVRGLAITEDGQTLYSASRDSTIKVWSLVDLNSPAGHKSKKVKVDRLKDTWSTGETLESMGWIRCPVSKDRKGKAKEPAETQLLLFTGGDAGRVRLWNLDGKVLAAESAQNHGPELYSTQAIPSLSASEPSLLAGIRIDQNITFYHVPSLKPVNHAVGFNDQIIDTVFLSSTGGREDVLAVATNSEQVRLYSLDPEGFSQTSLLSGHTDIVLCLAKSADGTLLMTGSKDKTARIWAHHGSGRTEWRCIGICSGHVESVGAVALYKSSEADARRFAVTASQDRTIKVWDLSALSAAADESLSLPALFTQKVHDKDINALDIAPNDRLLATASQDKTAKLFALDMSKAGQASVKLLGTLAGHKRGVWSVKFSPTDQVVATASGDKSIKLWNVNDFTCLKTLEGHSNTVLRVDFLSRGLQLVSCASDGLVKVWNIKDEETIVSLDNHDEKIWALAISKDERTIISGAADSVVSFWKDVTEEQEDMKAATEEQTVLQNQDYNNFVNAKDYTSAILLALSMDQPRRLLSLFTSVAQRGALDKASITGSSAVDLAITSLPIVHVYTLLTHIRDWNTSIRTSDVAQRVLHVILKHFSIDDLLKMSPRQKIADEEQPIEDRVFAQETGFKKRARISPVVGELIEGLIPYTDRHYARADRAYSQESFVLDYTLRQMDVINAVDLPEQPQR